MKGTTLMFDIFIMDMGGHDDNVQGLVQRFPHARVVRYYDNHLDTLKRCISRCRTPYAWVITSCCDYTDFDFDYHAPPWESYQLHCWASGNQEFGDTFLVNRREWELQKDVDLLEWYKDIHWHEGSVPRLPWPVVTYDTDDFVNVVKQTKFNSPYIQFARSSDQTTTYEPILWRDRAVHTFNRANSVSLVPREISGYLDTQMYDFPFVLKQKDAFLDDNLLDIIHISNGETNANEFYQHLSKTAGREVKRVEKINGRDNAFRVAAEMSTTDWFFKVPAKLKVDPAFDWTWQPDYLQEPKHYIFYADNPLNGLQYGHMALVAYNKKLVLDTKTTDLDFTLSQPHEVVPISSGIAYYNSDPLMTWRTAFRECVKLRDDVSKSGSIESIDRLDTWTRTAEGENSEWSLRGANDGVEYYESVNGDYNKLMLSYSWEWLSNYFDSKYSNHS